MPHRLVVAVLSVALAACTHAGPAAPQAAGAGPVRLDTALGRVQLPEAADRVVALEWAYAEALVSVGVPPVGVADVDGYAASAPAAPLPEDVVDVGPREEPSIDAVAALDPDLVLGSTRRHEHLLPELDVLAPTALFDVGPAEGTGLDDMAAAFRTIGAAVGRREDAERVLIEMTAAFAPGVDRTIRGRHRRSGAAVLPRRRPSRATPGSSRGAEGT